MRLGSPRGRTLGVAGAAIAVALSALTVVAGAQSSGAATAAAPVWVSGASGESVELGDHALDFDVHLGTSQTIVSASDNDLVESTPVTGTDAQVALLLRTSDGTTGALPAASGGQTALSGGRLGISADSTTLEGAHSGLTFDTTVTRPTLPSSAFSDAAAELSNAPIMGVTLTVTNTTTSTSDAAAVLAAMGSSCGAPQANVPSTGYTTISFCSPGEVGTRYLTFPSAGLTSGTGNSVVSDFAARGVLSGETGAGSAGVALAVPALAPGATWSVSGVYAAYTTGKALTAVGGATLPFYYTSWFPSATALLSYGVANRTAITSMSATEDASVASWASTEASLYAAVHALRGWRSNVWLAKTATGAPYLAVTEGSYGWLSTIDVGYEYQQLQTRLWPWASKLELDEWAAHTETDSAGHVFELHDVGTARTLTAGAAYDTSSSRSHMPIEENTDFVLMALLWQQKTGLTYNPTFLTTLLTSAESMTDAAGAITVSSFTACLTASPGTCRTSPAGTTYDGDLKAAEQSQVGNTILTLKLAVAEAEGASHSLGAGFATDASRHFTSAQPTVGQISSDSALAYYNYKEGYLGDALLYVDALGAPASVDAAAAWILPAIVANQKSLTSSCGGTCSLRASNAESETWVSKAVDTDVVAQWEAAAHPTWARPAPEATKIEAWSVGRTAGATDPAPFDQGTLEDVNATNSKPLNKGYRYPRLGSDWGLAPLGGTTSTPPSSAAPTSTAPTSAAPTSSVAPTTAAPTTTPAAQPVRIDTGSTTAYTDSLGNVWHADEYYTGGKVYTSPTGSTVTGTNDPKLYLNQRYGAFTYAIPLPTGTYTLTLKFADTYSTAAGQRVFSVTAQGATLLSDLDVVKEVGQGKTDDKTFTVTVTNGTLTLAFLTDIQNPMIEGIQVIPTA